MHCATISVCSGIRRKVRCQGQRRRYGGAGARTAIMPYSQRGPPTLLLLQMLCRAAAISRPVGAPPATAAVQLQLGDADGAPLANEAAASAEPRSSGPSLSEIEAPAETSASAAAHVPINDAKRGTSGRASPVAAPVTPSKPAAEGAAAAGRLYSWGLKEWRLGRMDGNEAVPLPALATLQVASIAASRHSAIATAQVCHLRSTCS